MTQLGSRCVSGTAAPTRCLTGAWSWGSSTWRSSRCSRRLASPACLGEPTQARNRSRAEDNAHRLSLLFLQFSERSVLQPIQHPASRGRFGEQILGEVHDQPEPPDVPAQGRDGDHPGRLPEHHGGNANSILTPLKAGESVCHTLFAPKSVFQALRTIAQMLFSPGPSASLLL